MKLAILGTRGIPARYGGFETFAEELSSRLVKRGHEVSVYGRRRFFEKPPRRDCYRGATIIETPTVMHKYLETPIHALTSFVDLLRRDIDVVLLCNAANSPFAWIARIKGVPVAVNVDGVERLRAKWNVFGRLWYRFGEKCSLWFASRVIGDAQVIADYYKKTYDQNLAVIAYGAKAEMRRPGRTLHKYGLKPRRYFLYVSRLEPENNALGVITAYNTSDLEIPLVIVGDAPYAAEYKERITLEAQQCRSGKVIFTGFQFGEPYQELQSNSYCYIQATEVGGTHPALIEAMAYQSCVIANETPEHIEVLGDTGLYYRKNDFNELAEKLKDLAADPALAKELGKRAHERASRLYNWERITDLYEELFVALLE